MRVLATRASPARSAARCLSLLWRGVPGFAGWRVEQAGLVEARPASGCSIWLAVAGLARSTAIAVKDQHTSKEACFDPDMGKLQVFGLVFGSKLVPLGVAQSVRHG